MLATSLALLLWLGIGDSGQAFPSGTIEVRVRDVASRSTGREFRDLVACAPPMRPQRPCCWSVELLYRFEVNDARTGRWIPVPGYEPRLQGASGPDYELNRFVIISTFEDQQWCEAIVDDLTTLPAGDYRVLPGKAMVQQANERRLSVSTSPILFSVP